MTVSTSTNSVVYRGNGATTQFAVPFKVLDEDHLVVTRRDYATGETLYTYTGTDYTYSGIGADAGTLTLAGTALDDDYELVIKRIVPYTQDLDIVNAGGFYPETVEEQLDLMVMQTQQLVDVTERSIVVPDGEDGMELSAAADRAGMFFGFGVSGGFVALSGTGADSALRTDLASNAGDTLIGTKRAAPAILRALGSVLDEMPVPVSSYTGFTGDGTANDTVAIQLAIDNNKAGLLWLPPGYRSKIAGLVLSGATYNGTRFLIEGELLLAASAGANNWTAEAPMWGGIIVHDVDGFYLDMPGIFDGNRAAQADSEAHYLLAMLGVRNVRIPRFACKEIQGDGIIITTKRGGEDGVLAITNSSDIQIGQLLGRNSAADGRNLISLCSGVRIDIGQVISRNIGGVVNSIRQPGGLCIEPYSRYHLVEQVTVGTVNVETSGTGGVTCAGISSTATDATEDWNIRDVKIAAFQCTMTGGYGGPVFRRVDGLKASGGARQTARGSCYSLDYLRNVELHLAAADVAIGATLGASGTVRDFDIDIAVDNHNNIAVQFCSLADGDLTVRTRRPQTGGNSYGLGIGHSLATPRAITLTNVRVHADIPYAANLSGAVLITADGGGGTMAFGVGTVLTGALAGYDGGAGAALQFITRTMPSRNVEGRHFKNAAPTAGLWAKGELIWNTEIDAAEVPGWACTTLGTAGSTAVFKAMAAVAA